MADDTRTDAEVRAAEAAQIEGDAVQHRAIGGRGTVVRNRRAQPDTDVKREETRGIYRDLDGRRRVVAAGDPIPDGWTRIESASVEDRVGNVATAQDPGEGAQADTTSGGGRSRARSRS